MHDFSPYNEHFHHVLSPGNVVVVFISQAFYGADMSTKTQHPLPLRKRKVVTGACLVAATLAAVVCVCVCVKSRVAGWKPVRPGGGDSGKVEDFEGGRKKRRRGGGGRKQLFPHHLVFSQKKVRSVHPWVAGHASEEGHTDLMRKARDSTAWTERKKKNKTERGD